MHKKFLRTSVLLVAIAANMHITPAAGMNEDVYQRSRLARQEVDSYTCNAGVIQKTVDVYEYGGNENLGSVQVDSYRPCTNSRCYQHNDTYQEYLAAKEYQKTCSEAVSQLELQKAKDKIESDTICLAKDNKKLSGSELYQKAIIAEKRVDLDPRKRRLLSLECIELGAAKGSTSCMFVHASFLHTGNHPEVQRDQTRAFEMFRFLSNPPNHSPCYEPLATRTRATFYVGECYYLGEGVKKDHDAATTWLLESTRLHLSEVLLSDEDTRRRTYLQELGYKSKFDKNTRQWIWTKNGCIIS
jgi:hypothetical protein